MPVKGIVLAAPRSGSGKTVVTLGLLRLLRRMGMRVAGAKIGPDYIDPTYIEAASGRPAMTIDPWAMRPPTIAGVLESFGDADLLLIEGVMGLFDGGEASTATAAKMLGAPVMMVMDVKGQGETARAVRNGLSAYDPAISLVATIYNRVGSDRHRTMLGAEGPSFFLPESVALAFPARHLGLVPIREQAAFDHAIDEAADALASHIDIEALVSLAQPLNLPQSAASQIHTLFDQAAHIAVAEDDAFRFCYAHLRAQWKSASKKISVFSPLADQPPPDSADAIFLPGGYPELHGARLAGAASFRAGMAAAARRSVPIYGECGGYMVLGRTLIDGAGANHSMLGLLPLVSDFSRTRLHLGYRDATLIETGPLGQAGSRLRGHEFHYATVIEEGPGAPLLDCGDRSGEKLGPIGRRCGTVMGSFFHYIDAAP
ncbi:MAG TPA: cobyrinate a,c-diamide synthase [Dongiaceae bacterium]|jgi:cobyrinic acid a,c-diamide synthase|nr:cobyrinate a,c-diamide synthase [Dongiaceae bacterium]